MHMMPIDTRPNETTLLLIRAFSDCINSSFCSKNDRSLRIYSIWSWTFWADRSTGCKCFLVTIEE